MMTVIFNVTQLFHSLDMRFKMFCFKCGKEIRDESVFCPFCGFKKKKSNNLLLFSIIGIWIIWVVGYLVYLRPFVREFFFETLDLPSFPGIIHLIILFGVPFILLIYTFIEIYC